MLSRFRCRASLLALDTPASSQLLPLVIKAAQGHSAAYSSQPLPPTSGPLVGIKVLDLGQVVAGNFAGGLLAYFGAEVIKIEPPNRGDALRHLREADASGTSLWWRSYGRNRRCMTIDLHNEEGRQLVRQLSDKVDVLVENFRPGRSRVLLYCTAPRIVKLASPLVLKRTQVCDTACRCPLRCLQA